MTPHVDHVVVNVLAEMDAAVRRYAALGFVLGERGYHSLGSINHLVLFEHDYLELVGIEPGAEKIRQEVAEGPRGLNGLVLRSDDARAVHARLQGAGLPVLAPLDFERPVEVDGTTVPARFTTVRLGPGVLGAGRVYYCEHHTPELVWRAPLPVHPNGASGVAAFLIVARDPLAAATRWAEVTGSPPLDAIDGNMRIDLGGVDLQICAPDHVRRRFGAFGSEAVVDAAARHDVMGAITLRTTSLDRARACLREAAAADAGVLWRDDGTRLTVAAASAWDCPIEFVTDP